MGYKLATIDNATIMDAVRLNASTAYQDRIPSATIGGINQAMAALDKFTPMWNEFIEVFINSIAGDYFTGYTFTNPLARFERGAGNGATIRETSVELIKARNYTKLGADVFHGQVPKVNVNYHYQNRQDQYDLELNRQVLSQAMGVDGGLMELLAQLGNTIDRSNTIDTYLIERATIGEYFAHNNSEVYNVNVPDILTAADKAEAGRAIAYELTRIQGLMAFPTSATDFIPNHNPGSARETVLWVTPAVEAAFRTYVLPYAFHEGNLDLGEMANSIQVIDRWPQGVPEGTQCVLADSKWAVWAETMRWSDSIRNPSTGSTILYFNLWGIYSTSRMVPVVRFSTDATTPDAALEPTYTALQVTNFKNAEGNATGPLENDAAAPSNVPAIAGSDSWVTWRVTGENQPNNACIASVIGNTSSNTFIDNSGKLYVASEESATTLTVALTSVFNPALSTTFRVSVLHKDAE